MSRLSSSSSPTSRFGVSVSTIGWAGSFLALVAIQMVVWWGYDGHTTLHGDCVGETSSLGKARLAILGAGHYLSFFAHRSLLGLSYYEVRHGLFGGSFEKGMFLFAAFDVLGVFLTWLLLRRLVSTVPALLGALLFAGYMSAFDTQTVFCMGFYPVVLCIHVFLLWLGFSERASLWMKALLTGLLGVLSLAWYEFFIAVLPLYFLIWTFVEWERGGGGKAWRRPTLAFLFPALLTLGYLRVLSSAAKPVWDRDAEQGLGTSLPHRLIVGAMNAANLTAGGNHWRALSSNLKAFELAHAPYQPMILALAILIVVLVVVLTIVTARQNQEESATGRHAFGRVAVAVALGLCLMIGPGGLSGLIAVDSTFPRFTLYPSLGLAILIAGLLQVVWIGLRSRKMAIPRLGLGLMLVLAGIFTAWSLTEAVALNSITHQQMEARRYDDQIVARIAALYPEPRTGDHFFLCMPPPEQSKSGVWFSGYSTFQQGEAYAILWYRYGTEINALAYTRIPERKRPFQEKLWQPLIEASRQGTDHLVPFFRTQDGEIRPISKLQLLGDDGQVVNAWEYPVFGNEGTKGAMTVSLRP